MEAEEEEEDKTNDLVSKCGCTGAELESVRSRDTAWLRIHDFSVYLFLNTLSGMIYLWILW